MNSKTHTLLRGFLNIWSLFSILLLVATIFLYAKWNGFGEQGEVSFATVSWLLYQGYPLYTDIDFPARYSLQHGPIVYLLAGGIMKLLGPGYLTAKLSGVLAVTAASSISWLWFAKLLDKKDAFLLLGLETWILFHWHHIFFIRPDGMMLLCVVVSMYMITTKVNRWSLILGLALPLAVMANLKVHGVLYFLPIVMIAYERLEIKNLIYAGGLALLISILPFLVPQISFQNYVMWLTQSLHHGFSLKNFIPKIAMFLVLFLIPITIGKIYGLSLRSFYLRHKGLLLSLLFSLTVISVIASKGGSGTNHIMPFVPIFCYLIALLISELKERDGVCLLTAPSTYVTMASSILLTVIILVITTSGISTEGRFLKLIFNNDRILLVQDLQAIEKQYAGKTLAIGYGEDKSYDVYRDLIPLPVFKGNPFLIEAVALADMNVAGIPMPAKTIATLEEGVIQVWLIPTGSAPFAMSNGPKRPLFSMEFQQSFMKNYKLISRTQFFDIWLYRKGIEGLNE